MTEKMKTSGPPGNLNVSVGSDSMFLGQSVPIEVRDSRHRLVQRTTSSSSLELPAGLYEISAVLEDGRRHSAVVDVVGGQQTPVTLVADAGAPAEAQAEAPAPPVITTIPSSIGASLGGMLQNRFTKKMYESAETDVPSDAAANVSFVEARGAKLVRETRTLRIFECDPTITEVPTATFAAGNRRIVTSLPISPQRGSPSGSCAVRVEVAGNRVRAPALITPQRTVANALQNMMASDYLLQAASVAEQARDLLNSKYEDPAGAALGALLLYKTGKLGQFDGWVGNLARSFDWLPDGKILLARIHADRERPSPEQLKVCLRAAEQRPLYAECHALLLDLLRRWPGEDMPKERAKAVAQLSAVAPLVDSDSLCFSHYVPTPEEL